MMTRTFDHAIDDLIIASRKEIVFIEDNVADIDTLVRGIGSGKEIVILDATQDGLHQMAQALAGRSGIDALHVIAHGTAGAADFGALKLDGANAGAHGGDLQAIGRSLAAGGDILLYGCNIGAGENGAGFLEQLAIATGADVAASNDLTGSAALGGDWELEVASGNIEAPAVVNAQTAALYQQVLSIPSVTINFNTPSRFIVTSEDTSNPNVDTIYKVNGNPAYQLVIDGQDLGTSAYAGSVSPNPYVTAAPNGPDRSVTISFATGQIFTANSISIANFFLGTQDLVIKGYDSAGHQVGSAATPSLVYGANAFNPIPISLSGMTSITSLKITATSNSNLVRYLIIDDLSLTNVQQPPPQVTFVSSSTANGTYKIGDTIDVLVNFDNAVDVTGTPQLTLETGATDRTINYVGGSGSSALTFRYTVQAGDTAADLDYTNSAIALNGGTIKAYLSTQDASVTLPAPGAGGSLASNKNIVIDGIAPTVTVTSDKTSIKANDTATFTFTFSEDPGSSFTAADITASQGTFGAVSGTGLTRTAVYSGPTGSYVGSDNISVAAGKFTDTAGNGNTASGTRVLTIDTIAPNAPSAPNLDPASDSGGSSSDDITRQNTGLVFNGTTETGVSIVKLYDTDGVTEIASTSTITGATYTVTTTGTLSNGVHTITAKAYDAAGNVSSASGSLAVTVDRTSPGVAVSFDKTVLKAGETATVTFTFTEDPGTSFTSADLAYNGGSPGAISGSGTTRTATFTPSANVNSGTASIGVTAASYADDAGNAGAGGTSGTITYDTLAPTLTITSSKPVLKAGETAAITFTFSEDPGASFSWDGTSGSVTVGGGTLSAISGSGTTRTATFTPAVNIDSGTASISVATGAYTDAHGNPGGAGAPPSITYDTLAPGAPSAPDLAIGDDSGADSGDNLTNANTPLHFSGTAGAGTTVKLYDGAAEIGSGTADGGGNWNITTSAALAAGSHTITAKAIDAAGNASAASSGLAVTVDHSPPSVAIASDKSTMKAGDTATITFTFTEDPGTSFSWDGSAGDVSVSGGTLSAIAGSGLIRTATFTPDTNADAGTASITVTGAFEDAAGNAGTGGATPSISFDTLAPAAPSAPDLDGNHDSGASSTDDITNDTTTIFSGSADVGATVKLYDGAAEIGSIAASGGSWTIPVIGLGEGSHTLTARAFDAAGNASAASGALTLVVDKTPPSTTVGGAQLSDDTGDSDSDMITSNGTQTISGTLGAGLGADEQVMVSTNNGATWTAATASAGSAAWELAAATLSGSGAVQVRIVDAAGNAGPTYAHAYTIDTTPPAAPSALDLDTGSDSGSSDRDDITGVTQPGFNGSAENGATVRLYDGATEIGHATASGGTWNITPDAALAPGSHSITARATDLAGNTGDFSSPLTVQVITGGPSTHIETIALSSDSGAAGDFITNEKTQAISGTLDAVLAAGERVQFSLDQGGHWSDATSVAGSAAWSFPATLTEGTHDIRVRVLDAVDNPGPVHVQAYTLDTVPPALVIGSSAGTLKAGETATITFTFSEDPGTSFSWDGSVSVSGGALLAITSTGAVRTATFTPTADTDNGTASVSVDAGKYHDAAGNGGAAGVTPVLHFDTLAPGAASTPNLDRDSDSGALDTDNLTQETVLVFSGTAEAGATVRLYDSDGATEVEIGHGTAVGGAWQITTSALLDGAHIVMARVFDAAGNASAASGPITVTVDATDPAALAAPTLAVASDSGVPDDRITSVRTPTFSGIAEALAQVTLYDGATVIDSIQADAAGAWHITAGSLLDGVHTITARQVDGAGNASAAGAAFELTIDTVAPAAPGAPTLKATSDTGTIGDGVTQNNLPVIEGTALANTLVTLYDTAGAARTKVGTAMADGAGKWSVAAGLGYGTHTLSATQQDAAGNESAASAAFVLRIDAPPVPVTLIDGVAVDIHPISLPGGVLGSAVSIPIVSTGRVDSSGSPGVADIPLFTGGTGADLLLAQVAPGYGLFASGASLPNANAGDLLLAAIKAVTPSHASTDQGHLTGNGQSFLAGLPSGGSLLVETVKPVGAPVAPGGALTLSGPAAGAGQGTAQSTALVIDAGGLGAGAMIVLQQVNFAAVIGAANVVANSSMVLSGDAASQHFTVAAGGSGSVFAGGGSDTLSVAAGASALLHGGAAGDVATFSGARADYNLEFHNGYLVVASRAAPNLKTMVVNVEQLQFSDGGVTVDSSAEMGTLAGLYQTVLGRQADVMGIDYWAGVHQAGASWGAIALTMIASSEHAASHEGFNGVAAHDVGLLYTAIFNRDADAGGLAYWTAAMGRGTSLEQVASGFVQSVEMVGHQRAALDWDFIVG